MTAELGLVQCGLGGEPQGVSISSAALARLMAGTAPLVPCPSCDGQCGASFTPAKPRGVGMLLAHEDDAQGGRWLPATTWPAQVR
jgi:hypothetical protein